MFKSLAHFIDTLEQHGELVRVKDFVDPKLEITDVVDRLVKQNGPALLFENTGTAFPLLINAFGSEKRMCLALGVNKLDQVANDIESLMKDVMKPKDNIMEKLRMLPTLGRLASWMPKSISGRGECQQVILREPDITQLPVMTCWPHDGGPFLTLPVINTKDPITGIRNVGMYRMQVFGPTLTAMHWHKHKVSARHFNEYKKLGVKMPVAVALGGDPVYTYSATAPLPDNIDEYMLAGFLRKKKVELVKCITQDIEVPADADIIIEGYVDPADELIWEGPFGDHTGYYSLADYYPRFHITCITHKKNAIYPSTIVGIPPQEDGWLGKATERIFLAPIKMTMVPEIVDMEMPLEGVFHNLTIVKIKKEYSGQALKVMNAMWGAGQMMFNKIMVVVDEGVEVTDYKQVAQAISQHCDPQSDIYFSQGPMDVLDHSCSKFAFGGKMCIDATAKTEDETRPSAKPSADVPDVAFAKNSVSGIEALQPRYPEINAINAALLRQGVNAVFISVTKDRSNHVRELNTKLFEEPAMQNVKFVFYLEDKADAFDLKDAVWRFANNLDPRRDSFVVQDSGNGVSHIGMDGTRKTKAHDNFDRDWPNILAMDEATMDAVDAKWERFGLGAFIESPSRKYAKQLYAGGAVAE